MKAFLLADKLTYSLNFLCFHGNAPDFKTGIDAKHTY